VPLASCYTTTLYRAAPRLPVEPLAVGTSGMVTGFKAAVRFARIVVAPTGIAGDVARQPEDEAAASWRTIALFSSRREAPRLTEP
jgi:hypothetical protein